MEMIKTRQENVEEHIAGENKNENTQNKEKESNKEANTENIIKVKAWLEKIVYPKPPKVLGENDDTWGVTHWAVGEVLMGEPVESRYGTIIITGEFYGQIHEGQMYTLLAKETETSYGIQYQLMYYKEDTDFKKVQNQRAFLKTFLTQGQIEEMFKVLDDPLDSIANHDEEALMQVKGIGPYISKRIIERFEENKDMSEVYIELDKYGVTPDLIGKLVRFYKAPQKIIQVIKENPYQLTFDIDGIGFVKADKIALNGGIGEKSYKRIAAWINWFLEEQGNQGHSYITASELLSSLFYAFDGRENIEEIRYNEDGKPVGSNIGEAMNYLQEKGVISVEEREDGNKSRRRVYLTKYWQLEKDIADNLKRLLRAENRFNYANWEEKIEALEARQGFPFADEQKKGILLGLQSQVCFISGLGGTGKSSLVAGILAALDEYEFAQCSLSGKAAARLTEVTGKEGMTIHRLLGYQGGGFNYNENNKLPFHIIILDEVSLCGGEIFLDLVKAIETGSKLVILGDSGQLEAIGALNIAADLLNSDLIPTVQLKEVHRQAKASGIITSAHKVRYQEQLCDNTYEGIEILGELKDFEMDVRLEKDEIKDRALNYFEKFYVHPLVNKDIMKIQMLSPVRERGSSCVHELNLGVQAIINPVNEFDATPKIKMKMGKDKHYFIQIGDKVMCIKNNYRTQGIDGVVRPIFNGWTGIIKDIDDNYVYVHFPLAGSIIVLEKKEASSYLVLGYASTVHKCVTGDSWIYTNKGIMQIRDVTENMIGELEVFNGEELEKPNAFYVNQEQECLKLWTEKNHTIAGLPDHKMYVLSSNGEFQQKELKDIQIGDCLKAICPNYLKEDPILKKPDEWSEKYELEKVVKIEKTFEPTYCFNMPETHRFIANGFLSSNCQGSDYPVVIGVIDYSTPPQLLTSQLIYTLITRAKKYCVLVAQNGALRKAVATDFVSTKRTFLPELLEND